MKIVLEPDDLIPQCAKCGNLKMHLHSCVAWCTYCGSIVMDHVPQGTPQPSHEEMNARLGKLPFATNLGLQYCNLPKMIKENERRERLADRSAKC